MEALPSGPAGLSARLRVRKASGEMSSFRVADFILALLVAGGFVAVGDLLLGRRARWGDWTTSFLVGLGVFAALLFPLSLLLPGQALAVEFFVLVAGSAARIAAGRFQRSPNAASARTPKTAWKIPDLACWTAILCCAAAFAVLDWRVGYRWDGFHIWASKAMVLYHQGDIRIDPAGYDIELLNRTAAYPFALPLFEALVSVLRGGFSFDAFKPIFLIFYAVLLISTYRLCRAFAGRTVALASVAVLALLPAISTDWNIGGYSDMPLAAYVAACAAELLAEPRTQRGWRSPGVWLLGSIAMVKSEGSIYLVVGAAMLLACT